MTGTQYSYYESRDRNYYKGNYKRENPRIRGSRIICASCCIPRSLAVISSRVAASGCALGIFSTREELIQSPITCVAAPGNRCTKLKVRRRSKDFTALALTTGAISSALCGHAI